MKKLFLALLAIAAVCPGIYDAKWFDRNRWLCPFYNDGRWGYDATQGNGIAGGSWPQPLKNYYIFGAGLWVGSIVDGDTLVSVGYNPNSGGTELTPTLCRYWREGTGNPDDRVYVYPEDWPPPQSRFPMAPQQALSEMDMWCAFSDADSANHVYSLSGYDVASTGAYAYMPTQAGLVVTAVADPKHATEVARYRTLSDCEGVAVEGNHAYVAEWGDQGGLRVLDVSDPLGIHEVGSCSVAYAWRVTVEGDYAYVTTYYMRTLRIVDISDPTSPRERSYCSISGPGLNIAAAGGYVYVAASDSGLLVIDATDPRVPHQVGSCLTPGFASDVAVSGGYAYVATDSGLRVIDISDPANPTEVAHCPASWAYGVAVAGDHAYLSTSAGLRVIDISDPLNPVEVGQCDTPGSAPVIVGNYAYLAGQGLSIVNVSNPRNPYEAGRTKRRGGPLGIDVYLTVYGFSDSIVEDVFFLKYQLANASGRELAGIYFGLVTDPDVGQMSDDMVGLLLDDTVAGVGRVTDVGYAGDWNNSEVTGSNWESGTPGVAAAMLLSSPAGLGLTAFKKVTIDADPLTDIDQYVTMAGYDYRTGVYSPYDSTDSSAADKRFLMSSGPFSLMPDSVATFFYAVVAAPYGGPGQPWPERRSPANDSLAHLARRCLWARQVFEERLDGDLDHERPRIGSVQSLSGFVRDAILLPGAVGDGQSATGHLLDITGRRVMELRPGENDVRHLAPGVYFVRRTSDAGPDVAGTRRVVIYR
jgi:hypothetical protein